MLLSLSKWQVQVYPSELGHGTGNTKEENENFSCRKIFQTKFCSPKVLTTVVVTTNFRIRLDFFSFSSGQGKLLILQHILI